MLRKLPCRAHSRAIRMIDCQNTNLFIGRVVFLHWYGPMTESKTGLLKRGTFNGMEYVCAKKYRCRKGELILTEQSFTIKCDDHWTKTLPIREVRFEAHEKSLEVRTIWYNKLLFTLSVDEPQEWKEVLHELESARMHKVGENLLGRMKEESELKKLLHIDDSKLKILHHKIKKQRPFDVKNIRFNLRIQDLLEEVKDRKLKAFIIAHCYVAWYEWTKKLFYEIYKAKLGKGPKNDDELQKFLRDYPQWNFLSTKTWGIRANHIRNCVAHEKFHYDYKDSEIVFLVHGKEKRLKLIEMKLKLFQLSHIYPKILAALREKIRLYGVDKET